MRSDARGRSKTASSARPRSRARPLKGRRWLRAAETRASMSAGQRNEAHRQDLSGDDRSVGLLLDEQKVLGKKCRAHWHHYPTPGLELTNQRRWHVARRGSDDDRVEGSAILPAVVTVTDLRSHPPVTLLAQAALRLGGQGLDDLDGAPVLRQLGQYGGLVAGPRSDLEHSVFGLVPDQVGHQRDDVGLRNSLAVAYGQRPI